MNTTTLPDSIRFFEYVEWFQKLRFKEIEESTATHHKGVMKKIKGFKENLTFDDIPTEFIREYAIYLKDKFKNVKSTINKNLTTIKIYMTMPFAAWR